MTQQSNRLQSVPSLQRQPTSPREWNQFINELSKWVADLTQEGVLRSLDILTTVDLFNAGSLQNISPLTATDAGSDATITIAAHTVHYGSTTLAYNSGSITGLSFDTVYWVYADDPNKLGGAVTYVATTTVTDVTSNIGRYFVAEITTPADGSGDTSGGQGGGGGGQGGPLK